MVRNKKLCIKVTELRRLKSEFLQYFDDNGYVTWSQYTKKYTISTNRISSELIKCPECNSGKLYIIRSSTTMKRFIGCSNYFNGCHASSPLIQKASLCILKTRCKLCSWPICRFRYNKKQNWIKQCTNIKCKKNLANEHHDKHQDVCV